VRARALVAVGFLAALTAVAVTGCAIGTGGSGAAPIGVAAGPAASRPAASAAGCATDAYRAIRARRRLTSAPAECRALTPSQRNVAVGLAIRMASATGGKSAWRRQAGAAAAYVSALISGPPPTVPGAPPSGAPGRPPTASGGSRLGFSEPAAEVAALLAWLAAAGSGGWILIRWSRAGGRLTRPPGAADAAPAAVIVGHGGLGLLGLTVWTLFMATGWAALAWISVGLLAPVAGLGLTVLLTGLPRSRSAAASSLSPTRSGRPSAAIIAGHGLFVVATLLLALLAAIGA
jgi:manganese efflux pump family protein